MNLDFDKVKAGLRGMGAGFTSMGQHCKGSFYRQLKELLEQQE
jgi:hypothetical protein